MTQPMCFTDCETTSLSLDRLPWEVAFINRETNGSTFTYHGFIDVGLDRADPVSLDVGGYYDRHPRGRWLSGKDSVEPEHDGTFLLPEYAVHVIDDMTRDRCLVSSTAFDPVTYELLLHEFKMRPRWDYHTIDVQALALGWLRGYRQGARFEAELRGNDDPVVSLPVVAGMPPWRSVDLSRLCGVEPPARTARHQALTDADWVLRWYDALTGGAS